jgi:hypothetical protein
MAWMSKSVVRSVMTFHVWRMTSEADSANIGFESLSQA